MEYLDFLECIRDLVEKVCPKEDSVVLRKVTKNNSFNLDCIMILKPDAVVTPTIYLNGYFNDFLEGKSLEKIADEIVASDDEARNKFGFNVEDFTDFDIMKSRIACKLVNRERNLAMLNEVPHKDYLDFAVVYYFYIENTGTGCATSIVNKSFLDRWNIDEDMLHEIAMENTPVIMKPVIKSMVEILGELIGSEGYSDEQREDMYNDIENLKTSAPEMFVLTNKTGIFGAAGILNEKLLCDFGKTYGNFFILPSSIHELIFVPDDKLINGKELEKMVKDVNITRVNYDEYLSDYVYYYDTDRLSVEKLN